MKDPSKKTIPNCRRTFDVPMGKSNAPKRTEGTGNVNVKRDLRKKE